MIPASPMVCPGTVFHRRNEPRLHQFSYPVSYLWLDPDRPEDVSHAHWAWSSHSALAPVRFRTADYGLDPERGGVDAELADLVGLPLGWQARSVLHRSTGLDLDGPVRMISQPRRWGWLFNPITVYVIWGDAADEPAGAVVEVTNTPWKERHHYALLLEGDGPDGEASRTGARTFNARFDKVLHVSPFLHEDYHYDMRLTVDGWPTLSAPSPDGTRLELGLDVVDGSGTAVVETLLRLNPQKVTSRTLGRSLLHDRLPTHRTSFGIHHQALKLAAKRVPFIAHPRSRT